MIGAILASDVTRRLVVAGIIALSAYIAGVGMGKWLGERRLSVLRAEHAEQVAEWHRLAAQASATALLQQQQLQARVQRAQETLDEARRHNAALAADMARVRVDRDRLRKQLSTYAAGAGDRDTVAACQARAGTLTALLAAGAELVEACVGLAQRAAAAHDERAAEVEALLAAWPRKER
jgi:hypothetical protein